MAEIDDIKQRATRRYTVHTKAAEIEHAYEDRVFLLNLLDTMAAEHLAEIRQMEQDFREHMATRGGGA